MSLGLSAKQSLVAVTAVLVLAYSFTMIPTVQAQTPPRTDVACVIFSQNGLHVGNKHCSPVQANDVHATFSGQCSFQFSSNGQLIGTRVLCPTGGVNGFTLRWDTTSGLITHFTWTTNGNPVSVLTVPSNANDFHLIAQSVTSFQWSLNGGLIGHAVTAPEGANDFEGAIVILTSPSIPDFPFSYSLIIMFVAVAAIYVAIRQNMIPHFKGF